jgi:hypothetical protein
MATKKQTLIIVFIFGIVLIFGFWIVNKKSAVPDTSSVSLKGAPAGMAAITASTSRLTVGTNAAQIIATSTNCVSRIVTTKGQDVWFSFADGAAPGIGVNDISHYQAASTTLLYDAETYGCGLWKAIAETATNITLTEFKGFR